MIFPTNRRELENRIAFLIAECMATREDRNRLYDWREKYFLFGTGGFQPAKYNRIASHLDMVSSFIYAPSGAFYHIAAPLNSDDRLVQQALALQDDFNDDFTDSFVSNAISDSIDWALVYDTMILKIGWNRATSTQFAEIVPPHNFGVYHEHRNFENQVCFCHTFFLDYQEAVLRVARAGRMDQVPRLEVTHSASVSPFPQMLQRMIIASTGGTNLAGNVLGQINPDYAPMATYQPESTAPLVRFHELWAWDDYADDWRVFHALDPDILLSGGCATSTNSCSCRSGCSSGSTRLPTFSKSRRTRLVHLSGLWG